MNRREFLSVAGLGALGTACGTASAGVGGGGAASAGRFDVCVVGGSCTGVFAALRAAEAGCTVAIVENHEFFGGTATAGLVPIWHALHGTDCRTQIIGGYTKAVVDRLVSRREAVFTPPDPKADIHRSYTTFNSAALTLELDRLVREQPKVRPFLSARFVAAECDAPGHLARVIFEDKSGRRAIEAKFFIDATGDADLLARAGFETWKLSRDGLQAHTTCAILSGLDRMMKEHPEFDYFTTVMHPKSGAKLDHVFQWTAPVVGSPGLLMLAATRVPKCDPTDADDLTRGTMESRAQLARIVDTANRLYPMKDGKPAFGIVAVAPQLGIRESRHARCLYSVTDEDVLTGRKFDDVVARGTYRIDIHEGKGITFRYLDGREDVMVADERTGGVSWRHGRWREKGGETPLCYEIPYRAMVPVRSKNVLCAGRMLDCARAAYGALRVMVNCNQMGEAAGRAAAKAIAGNLTADKAYPGRPII